jgi:hypothetical protein
MMVAGISILGIETMFENEDMIYIIWPDRRLVSESQVWSWYEDAVANGQIAEEYLFAHDLETAKRALSDSGLVTFGE